MDTGAKDVMYERLKQTISNNELEKLALMEELEKLKSQVLNESIFRSKYEQELKEKNQIIQSKLQLENLSVDEREKRDGEIGRMRKELAERVEEIEDLNRRLVEMETKGKMESSRLIDEIKRVEKELGSTKASEEKGRQEGFEISTSLQETQRQLSELNRKYVSLDSALAEAQSENEQLRRSNKSYSEETREQSLEIRRLTDTIRDL